MTSRTTQTEALLLVRKGFEGYRRCADPRDDLAQAALLAALEHEPSLGEEARAEDLARAALKLREKVISEYRRDLRHGHALCRGTVDNDERPDTLRVDLSSNELVPQRRPRKRELPHIPGGVVQYRTRGGAEYVRCLTEEHLSSKLPPSHQGQYEYCELPEIRQQPLLSRQLEEKERQLRDIFGDPEPRQHCVQVLAKHVHAAALDKLKWEAEEAMARAECPSEKEVICEVHARAGKMVTPPSNLKRVVVKSSGNDALIAWVGEFNGKRQVIAHEYGEFTHTGGHPEVFDPELRAQRALLDAVGDLADSECHATLPESLLEIKLIRWCVDRLGFQPERLMELFLDLNALTAELEADAQAITSRVPIETMLDPETLLDEREQYERAREELRSLARRIVEQFSTNDASASADRGPEGTGSDGSSAPLGKGVHAKTRRILLRVLLTGQVKARGYWGTMDLYPVSEIIVGLRRSPVAARRRFSWESARHRREWGLLLCASRDVSDDCWIYR